MRDFTEKEIMPFCHEWDEAKTLPKELFEKASAAGWLPVCVGAWPTVRAARALSLWVPRQQRSRIRTTQAYVGEPPEELKNMDYVHEARTRFRLAHACMLALR